MKYVKMAEGASSLFIKKVTVILESSSGNNLGKYKLDESLVPEQFDSPLVMDIEGVAWRVLRANVKREKSFLKQKILVLTVIEDHLHDSNGKHFVPTQAWPVPLTMSSFCYEEHDLKLTFRKWRQIEFHSIDQLAAIQEELKEIEKNLSYVNNPEPLLGFNEVHDRVKTGQKNLMIKVEEFCALVNTEMKGKVWLDDREIVNSFVLRTDNNVYYGIVEDGFIRELSLLNFEFVDDEFMMIASHHNLLLVNWCAASYTFFDSSDSIGNDVEFPGNENIDII